MKVVVIDTETTDVTDPEAVEVAAVTVGEDPLNINELAEYEERFRPSKPISFGAMAVHHIMEEDLTECRPSSAFRFPGGVDFVVGHNIDFDWQVIGSPDVKRICTLAMCRELWPEADSHTLSAMTYMLNRTGARDALKSAHSALADVHLCIALLKTIMENIHAESWEGVWNFSEQARVPKVMPFGKHKGTAMVDVPIDYKQWLMRQPDVDPYLMQALAS